MNFGLIGKSISHSFSKTYFEEKFLTENKNNFNYINFDLENLDGFREVIIAKSISGINVTKPYKEAIIPFLDDLDSIAKEIGAVNCIKISKKNNLLYLTGYNTDYFGFSKSIKPFLDPTHQKALILGTGGASKAIYYALKSIGVEPFFVTTGAKKAANYFNYSDLNKYVLDSFKLIVNCTPLGLFPNINECAQIPYQYVTPNHLLYDLIYNPVETLFLKKGKEQGATIINGLNMLKFQADKAWEIWNS